MITHISHISLLVHDQEQAAQFYTQKVGFVIIEDHKAEGFRWITIAPSEDSTIVLTLMVPVTEEDKALVGKQAGSLLLFVFTTDDCHKTAQELKSRGVNFIKEPTQEFWGIDSLFTDLYGNVIDVCQPTDDK